MGGRKPTPTALKVLKGNPGRRPLPKDEPTVEPLSEQHDPPATLTDGARSEWLRLAPRLIASRVLSRSDEDALEMLCETLAAIRLTRKEWVASPVPLVNVHGQLVTNPVLVLLRNLQEDARKLLAEFGMTPSSRTKVTKTEGGAKKNPFTSLPGGKRASKSA